ncbi:MAG TPA: hypothetical protein GXX51_02075 [Firmicutes bacterium]|nr:hypothetical protein [Bacillota bacterium]
MRCLFTLTPAESKRLIAMAVARMPEVRRALENGRIIIAGGTTNAFVAEELLGVKLEKGRYTAGVITKGRLAITPAERRLPVFALKGGKPVEGPWEGLLKEFGPDDVFIKGANAIDTEGNAGILVGGAMGGTIGAALPVISAKGAHLIMPVGLEKLVPSVIDAARVMGIDKFSYTTGTPCGMIPVVNGTVVTELEAFSILGNACATHVASGGIDGCEGACTFAVEGEDKDMENVVKLIKAIKGEPPLSSEVTLGG